jgi:hypothetical protein
MHAYVSKELQTVEFNERRLGQLGEEMGQTIHQHSQMINSDETVKAKIRK